MPSFYAKRFYQRGDQRDFVQPLSSPLNNRDKFLRYLSAKLPTRARITFPFEQFHSGYEILSTYKRE
jgi:hypothetical protein